MEDCQTSLHLWGSANQVAFEPSKESFHILDARRPVGDNFQILSVIFDPKLNMHEAVRSFASEAGWRLRTLLRVRRFYPTSAVIRLYKSNILSYLEGATPALYHACPSVLKPLDNIQNTLVCELGLSPEQALIEYSLAPLCMRRDIAMLGLLYKISRQCAPKPLQELFSLRLSNLESYGFRSDAVRHPWQIADPVEVTHPVIIKRSIFGLIRVFNQLPESIVSAKSVAIFQRSLQKRAELVAGPVAEEWQHIFRAN